MELSYSVVKNIYEFMGFGQFFRTNPSLINILALRAYYDINNTTNIYNDVICAAWLDASNSQQCELFLASTDPGLISYNQAVNKDGVATLMDGYLYWYYLSTRVATYFNRITGKFVKMQYPCMRNSSAEQQVWRDSNFDGGIDTTEYAMPTTGSGILIHYGGEKTNYVGAWSQGCQVIPSIDTYEYFIQLMDMNRNASNPLDIGSKEIPYLLGDVRKLPDEVAMQVEDVPVISEMLEPDPMVDNGWLNNLLGRVS